MGRELRLWKGNQNGTELLKERFPCLYSTANNTDVLMTDVFNEDGWSFLFRRYFYYSKCIKWDRFLQKSVHFKQL